MPEFWDIYNADRVLTGRRHERGKPLAKGDYHLVVHIWVQNDKGEFFITRRAPHKEPFADRWECTGGSALAGEDSETAALRETREETGIDHRTSPRQCVLSYRRYDWFGDVWLFHADFPVSAVTLQEGETTDAMWADKNTIRTMMKSGEFCEYDYIEDLFAIL